MPGADDAVARVVAGDEEAMADVYRRWSRPVYGYARSIVCDHHEAEDVTQQVFVKLLTVLPSYDAGRSDFATWLLRVTRNTAIDHLRRRRPAVVSDPIRLHHEAPVPDAESRRSLEDALAGLTPRQREVLLLRELLGLTPAEVAARIGATCGAVNTLHHRAREAARERLGTLGTVPATVHGRTNGPPDVSADRSAA